MRIAKAISGDIYFQWRYGFYGIYALLTLIYTAIISFLPLGLQNKTAAILIYSDPAAMGLFFMGAMILLEKSQGVLNALAVSPLEPQEYILSKSISLSIISTIVAVIIGFFIGLNHLILIALGTFLSSMIFTILGIIAATKIVSLNQFLFISVFIDILCFIPPIAGVLKPDWHLLRLHPFDAGMRLIYGSSQSILLDVCINLLVMIFLYSICLRQVKKMFGSVGGVKL